MKTTLIYLILYLFCTSISAQDVSGRGIPYLDNYMPEQYDNSGKIWDIQSNNQGILFFASDRGLLEFDGVDWKHYIGSKGSTRSLNVVSDSVIYTGSDLDFGKWEINSLCGYEYTSLYPFKDNGGQITEEFWDVHQMMDFIVFVSFNNVYVYNNDRLTKISAPYRFSGSYYVNEKLYLVDEKFGIYNFDGISLNLEVSFPNDDPLVVRGIVRNKNGLLISTQNQGLLILKDGNLKEWSKGLSSILEKDQVFCFTTINNDYLVFGTILNGMYITDKDGKVIQHINKQRGLPNNTILDLYYSPNGMLWLSMDLGITGIHLMEDIYYVFDHNGDFGTGQTALIDNEVFYLGTNQGLYTCPWNDFKNDIDGISFTLLPRTTGQVWSLAKVGNDLICGHDRGLFEISDGRFENIKGQIGVLDIVELSDDIFLAGTYNGIQLYQYIDGSWSFIKELELIKGACSQLVVETSQVLWIHIPNYGVIRAKLDENFDVVERKIFTQDKFQGDILHLAYINSKVHIITDQGKYLYDPISDEVKVIVLEHYEERVKHRLTGNYYSRQISDTLQFYPVYNGFALKHKNRFEQQFFNDTLLLRRLEIYNQDTSFAYSISEPIPFAYNNLKVDIRVPHNENVNYRYFLEGYMENWSEWTSTSYFELLNLRENEYLLQVEGRLENGEFRHLDIPINIESPWYRTNYAYIGYLALLFLFGFSIYKLQQFKLAQQKELLLQKEQNASRLLEENYKKEMLVKKQEQLEREKSDLEKELRSIRIQLVMKAKTDEEKSRLIQMVSEKLSQMQGGESGNNRMKWKELYRIIDRYKEKEDNTFQIHMDELNQEFSQKLKNIFPELTVYDLRLCTYIKSGLSTKEVAEIMNVLPSSINVSRSRLRKKLNLNAKDDLYSFLEGLQ